MFSVTTPSSSPPVSPDPELASLQNSFPELQAAPAELDGNEAIVFPVQPTLSRELRVGRRPDGGLDLMVVGARFAWVDPVAGRTAIVGLMSGNYRLVTEVRGERTVKAELMNPQGLKWGTISRWQGQGRGLPWQRRRRVVSLRRSR